MTTPPLTGPNGESERLILQLLALNKAALAITGELDLDRVLQRIVDSARELADCKYSALGVLGSDGYIERFPTSGISKVDREKIGAPPRGHGLLGVMLRAGRTLRIPDINTDHRRVGFPDNHPPMTSLLGVPIFVRGTLVGDIYMTDKKALPEFTEEDEWLLQLLATHASTALTNARLHAENLATLRSSKLARARSDALFRVTEAINRSMQLDEVISLIVTSAVELLSAAGAALYLLGQPQPAEGDGSSLTDQMEVGRQFIARYAVGLESPYETKTYSLPVEGSVAGRALESGITQVVVDTEDEPDTIFPRLAGKELRSLVVVPLSISGQVLGVLSVYSDRKNAFDEEAVKLQEGFAAVASAAINNARLYEQARKGREAAEREKQRLLEVDQMKDEFLSTAAHELRTPLTAVRMASSLLYEHIQLQLKGRGDTEGSGEPRGHNPIFDARLLDLIGLVEEGSARMHSLVNDLLDLTRLEQGRANLQFEHFEIREIVDSVVESITPLVESKDQLAVVHLPELGCQVRGDRHRLEQVLINLLSNAHKYSPPGSPIEVRVIRSVTGNGQKECLVSVTDKGPGVPEAERERVFERFYRSSLHRNDRTASTGLGLPIARRIAEMHKGRIWVEAAPEGGSIFTLAIPAAG